MAKEKKQNILAIVTAVIAVLLIIILLIICPCAKKDEPLSDSSEPMMTFRTYDIHGNLIEPGASSFSIVEGTTGVYYIDISVRVDNTGTEGLVCDITSVSPPGFDSQLVRTTQSLPVGGSRGWTSGLIDVAPFESPTGTTEFSTEITCGYIVGTGLILLSPINGTLELVIRPDTTGAGFQVGLSLGGVGTEFCGDGICQTDEDEISCPSDCAVSANVQFRTTDLSYVSGTSVGYSSFCGDFLTGQGKTSGACATEEIFCDGVDYTLLVPSLSGTTKMWILEMGDGDICICDDGVTSHTYARRYTREDPDADIVDTSSLQIDSSKEVPC